MGFLDFFFNTEEKKHQMNVDDAKSMFQLQEFGGEIWITFLGNLVCPCSMLKDEPVEAVNKMRELYIKRSEHED